MNPMEFNSSNEILHARVSRHYLAKDIQIWLQATWFGKYSVYKNKQSNHEFWAALWTGTILQTKISLI